MTIHGILLIPNAEHRVLLDDGPCGAMPPLACRAAVEEPWRPFCGMAEFCTVALVLAWEGEVVPIGCCVLDLHDTGHPAHQAEALVWLAFNNDPADAGPDWGDVEHLGRVVFVDAEGQEVQP